MTTLVAEYGGALLATMKRDAEIWFSYRTRLISEVLTTLFTLTIFYYIGKLVRPGVIGPRDQYFAYVVVGIVTTAVLTSALTSAQIVRMELMQGNFERILIAPVGPVYGAIAVTAFPVAYSTVFSALMLPVAALVYGVPLHIADIPPALGVAVLGATALACLGWLFVASLLAVKSSLGATWVIAGLSLLGGAYFPLRLFPGWIRWASYVQPFTPTVDLLRHLLIGTTPLEPVWLEMVKLVGFVIVLIPLSVSVVALAVRYARKRGTIMEY